MKNLSPGASIVAFAVVLGVLLSAGGIVGLWTSIFGPGWLGVLIGAAVLGVPLAYLNVKRRRRIRENRAYFEDLRRREALGPSSSDG